MKVVDSTLVEMVIPEAPQNLVGDNDYDSDKLDAELRPYGIETISRTGAIARTEHKTDGVCADTADAGKSKGREFPWYAPSRLLPHFIVAFTR